MSAKNLVALLRGIKDSKIADMVLFPYRLFFIVSPPLVVSKCALAGKEKASLYTREPLTVTVCSVIILLVKTVL